MQFQLHANSPQRGITEAQILKPLFIKHSLHKVYLECLTPKGMSVLECLRCAIESAVKDDVEREMGLCAVWYLEIAVNVSTSTKHELSYRDLMALRSDQYALQCIRDWDRIYTIPKVLYLIFLLNARKLISHLTNSVEESDKISRFQTSLYQIISDEFPSNLMKEMKRELIDNGSLSMKIRILVDK